MSVSSCRETVILTSGLPVILSTGCWVPCKFAPMCALFLTRWGRGGESRLFPSARVDQALAESLKTNGSLKELYLHDNNIGDRGAEAPAAERLLAGVEDEQQFWVVGLCWRCGKISNLQGIGEVCVRKERCHVEVL